MLELPPAALYKTYSVRAPRSTHQRRARCAEVDCANYQNGWVTRVDEATDLGRRQAGYIRSVSERRFTEAREGGLTVFTFHAGQACFAEHWVSLDREPQYVVLNGGVRGSTARVHRSYDDWGNDLGDHLDHLRKERN